MWVLRYLIKDSLVNINEYCKITFWDIHFNDYINMGLLE